MQLRVILLATLVWLGACSGAAPRHDNATADEPVAAVETLPTFRLPAPRPSVRANLPRTLFANPTTVGDVSARLGAALDRAGYEDLSYYSVPGGFALVTEPERIGNDGKPFAPAQRWIFEATPLVSARDVFDDFPDGFLRRLRDADPGRYRLIVFLVTTRVVTTGGSAATFEAAQAWTAGGGDFLPSDIASIGLTPQHNISVLIYEFRRQSVAAPAKFLDPSALSARQHLAAAGMLPGGGR